ncbi:hypothetical protein BpHYR1_004595 [Brachionus plicatilis]|uniref:Uncharacterized protein n=1 Tax=Brachionus plicatilis TaxID=10195 RepID=A0A3M7PBC8_BRAPC|nr:hypothetical protein BpHYR1_004595 [Brachionus plicatilis]
MGAELRNLKLRFKLKKNLVTFFFNFSTGHIENILFVYGSDLIVESMLNIQVKLSIFTKI